MLELMMPQFNPRLIFTIWGGTRLILLSLMFSGSLSLVTVQQPPVVTAALGQTVLLPCQLSLSNDETLKTPPVLYWENLKDNDRLWEPTENYTNRVDRLDKYEYSFNKSILLRDVQWDDSGTYLCKVSIVTKMEAGRKLGDKTLLLVHDTLSFKLLNNSLLSCEVNVTRNPSVVLSITNDGSELGRTVVSTQDDAALPFVTLSGSFSVRTGGKYVCQLHLNTFLITTSSFNFPPTDADKGRDTEKHEPTTCTSTSPDPAMVVFPEPWLLYFSLLLVPIVILLGVIVVQLCL